MNADKSERIRCAEASAYPTRHLLLVDGWGFNQRAYIETATNDASALSRGVTLAAAMVPMPLTPIASSPRSLVGGTCRYGSTVMRSDSFTTSGQRSYKCRFQNTPSTYSIRSTTSPGRASRLLQERHIRSTVAGHLHQFAPRLLALPDVPAHDLDHPTTSASTVSPRRHGRVFCGWLNVHGGYFLVLKSSTVQQLVPRITVSVSAPQSPQHGRQVEQGRSPKPCCTDRDGNGIPPFPKR